MTILVRIAAVSVAGAILYFAGIVNSMVIYDPSRSGGIVVSGSVAVALLLIAAALRGRPLRSGGCPPLAVIAC